MTLTASDVASLSNALTWWERAEYFFTVLVVIACAGEYIADFSNWFTRGIEGAKRRLAKRSTLLLIAALSLELVCLVKTNSLSGLLIGSLSDKAGAADTKAESALAKSATAESKAGAAEGQAKSATDAVDVVQKKVVAVGKRAERIGADLGQTQWLMSSRRILNPDELSVELKKRFKGRYVILRSYVGDQEGDGLCRQLVYITQKAEMNLENTCSSGALSSPPMTSVVVSGPNIEETEEIGKLLVTVGRLSFGGTISAIKGPVLTIFVGYKPAFIIGPTQIIEPKQTSTRKAKQ